MNAFNLSVRVVFALLVSVEKMAMRGRLLVVIAALIALLPAVQANEKPDSQVQKAADLFTQGDQARGKKDFAKAKACYEKAAEIALAEVQREPQDDLRKRLAVGILYELGKLTAPENKDGEAFKHFDKAVEIVTQIKDETLKDRIIHGRILNLTGEIYVRNLQIVKAKPENVKKAAEKFRTAAKLLDKDSETDAEAAFIAGMCYGNLGDLMVLLQDYDTAIQGYKVAIDTLSKFIEEPNKDLQKSIRASFIIAAGKFVNTVLNAEYRDSHKAYEGYIVLVKNFINDNDDIDILFAIKNAVDFSKNVLQLKKENQLLEKIKEAEYELNQKIKQFKNDSVQKTNK